ncbi:hypothetical protein CDAR_273301 [Caerostris darwini]|uniref:Uncharacterized protein n=1 Tax=Caerostris darwini TaxID=1538125 RepID=A0AAV4W2V0_9ARAC|nr:hypothetical protein CDAR_273301 [Caerostris darwini]
MPTAFTYCEVKLSLYDSDSNLRIERWKQRKDQPSATILQNHNIAEIRTQRDANLKKKKCRFNGGCQFQNSNMQNGSMSSKMAARLPWFHFHSSESFLLCLRTNWFTKNSDSLLSGKEPFTWVRSHKSVLNENKTRVEGK